MFDMVSDLYLRGSCVQTSVAPNISDNVVIFLLNPPRVLGPRERGEGERGAGWL